MEYKNRIAIGALLFLILLLSIPVVEISSSAIIGKASLRSRDRPARPSVKLRQMIQSKKEEESSCLDSTRSPPSKRVAICFFGLTRSLKYTIDSIRTFLLDPLLLAGIAYDVYVHTYNSSIVFSPRAGERNLNIEWSDYKLLHPKRFQIDSAELISNALVNPRMQHILKNGDPWKEKKPHITLRNHVLALYSIKVLTDMWLNSKCKYDAVIVTRSDLYFFQPLELSLITGIQTGNIYIPSWGKWGGLNDRFALGAPDVMEAYGHRYNMVDEYVVNRPLHAESFVKAILTNKGWSINFLPCFAFSRVRANGVMWDMPQMNGCTVTTALPLRRTMIRDEYAFWKFEELLGWNITTD